MKRLICALLTICILAGTAVSVFAADSALSYIPQSVQNWDMVREGIEIGLKFLDLRMIYPKCKRMYPLFELDNGYVPQGFCYIDSENMYAVSYYSDGDENSILVLMDGDTGERIKTVNLFYDDGDPCRAHCGGVADVGDSLLISSGKSLRRLKLSDLISAEDGGEVRFCGTLRTAMQASFAGAYENLLFVGQFHCQLPKDSYASPMEHHLFVPGGGRNYAMCAVYDLQDMEAFFADEYHAPIAAISIPDNVQGIAYNGTQLITSCSATVFGSSKLQYYSLPNLDYEHREGMFTFRDGQPSVPLYYIRRSMRVSSRTMPPMMEGIDLCNGRVFGIFESGAEKFTGIRLRTPYICDLGPAIK